MLKVLPVDCIAKVLSLTTPADACRTSLVSTSFKSVAESNAVWDCFVPPESDYLFSNSSSSSPSSLPISSKKELFLHLCHHPLLIHDGKLSLSLEKKSGKKCYMLSPKDLIIVWIDTPAYWRWTSLPHTRFPEVAELIKVCWLEIRGRINTCILSPATLYAAYLVFKTTTGSYGFESQPIEVEVGLVGGEIHKQTVYLDAYGGRRLRYQIVPRRIGVFNRPLRRIPGLQAPQPQPKENEELNGPKYPKERVDGWLEIELGEFFNRSEKDNGELEMSVLEVNGGNWKGGLIVQGIEIRPKP
ncbi:hypothetical protein ACB098_07G090300 [Castanea mollissima]